MKTICQVAVSRNTREVDEGTFGFHDYHIHKESMQSFIDRVSEEANALEKEGVDSIIGISYPSEDMAIISYIVES